MASCQAYSGIAARLGYFLTLPPARCGVRSAQVEARKAALLSTPPVSGYMKMSGSWSPATIVENFAG